MGSILIAMPNADDANRLADLLSRQGLYLDIEVCQTASEILRISNDRDYGVIICTKNLKDMSFVDLSQYMPPMFGMIVLTKDINLDTYSENVMKLIMPFKTTELVSTINMITSFFIRKIKKKKSMPVKRSPEEEKIITSAKELLMDRNGLTEPEAFRYIQKSSMDTGRSMVESAEMILLLNK